MINNKRRIVVKKILFAIICSILPLPLSVLAGTSEGQSAQSNKQAVIEVSQLPAVVKGSGKNFSLIGISVDKVETPAAMNVTLSGGVKKSFEAKKGNNLFEIIIPEVGMQATIKAEVEFEGKSIEKEISVKPVPEWTI